MLTPQENDPTWRAFAYGVHLSFTSVFCAVLVGSFLGIGALAHAMGFSIWWITAATFIMWAGPAQVIMMTLLGSGAGHVETAVAVSLSGVRLFPMVVAILPLMRKGEKRIAPLILPAHFTAVSMWVQGLMVLPSVPRVHRIAFYNGMAAGYLTNALVCGAVGYILASNLPPLLASMLLFVTPLSFLISTLGNSRELIDTVAFVAGLVVATVLGYYKVELDLLWCGAISGGIAYAVHRWRSARRAASP